MAILIQVQNIEYIIRTGHVQKVTKCKWVLNRIGTEY
jgi:hypothetical protein